MLPLKREIQLQGFMVGYAVSLARVPRKNNDITLFFNALYPRPDWRAVFPAKSDELQRFSRSCSVIFSAIDDFWREGYVDNH